LVFPLRWWSFGPFWRYERPQKGRTREFFQWNIDLIGTNSPESDAELLAVCAGFFKSVGLSTDQVEILVNNRRLMDDQLSRLGIAPENRPAVFRLIDRQDKMRADEWAGYATEIGLSREQFEGVCRLLEDENLWQQSEELRRLFAALDQLGVRDYVTFEPKVIRGLDYYTGTVFEARDRGREGRAVLGGGHYDNLVADVGGEPLSGVGFAMGDVMITLVLEKYGLLPAIPQTPAPVLVTVFDADRLHTSMALASDLRAAGLNVICFTEAVKLNKQLKFADRMGMPIVIIIGPDEVAAGQVTVKDLVAHQQQTVRRQDAAKTIEQMLAGHRDL
ncbi:MAG TPA: HisS family protein, partial [Anaerolineaceae bacterium]|nr:HisS family protein [Anaerolineaceae bacterium]